jgi:hypothetical protein
VNLFSLRSAAETAATVELIAVDAAVMVPTAQGHMSLPVLYLVHCNGL